MTGVNGQREQQQCGACQAVIFRCCLLIPFIILFTTVLLASFIEIISGAIILDNKSSFFDITEERMNFHRAIVISISAGVILITAVAIAVAELLTIILTRKCCEEDEKLSRFSYGCMSVLMLVLCVVLLFGLILSFNTTGNESLQFDNKYDFRERFRKGSLQSLRNYITGSQSNWDYFQENYMCCGVASWSDYKWVFKNNSVPDSCCNRKTLNDSECTQHTQDVNRTDVDDLHYVYSQGCSEAVYEDVGIQLMIMYWSSTVAGIASSLSLLLLILVLIIICCRDDGLKNRLDCLNGYENV